jgi:predicted Rossmann-fold nucleotide-binding protein
VIEISDVSDLRARLDAGEPMTDVVLQNVPIDGLVDRLERCELDRTYLFGCTGAAGDLERLMMRGAAVFPRLPGLPFDPYRTELYRPEELFAGFDATDPCSYCLTPDAKIYDYWTATGGPHADSIVHALARRLHDHAISDALVDFLAMDDRAHKAVAVMGGHELLRAGDGPYAEIARLSRTLTREGFLMVSGGGPGAMEATHLGAWFADAPDDRLDAALAILERAARFDDFDFVAQAFAVIAANPQVTPRPSLGVPTWLYGHESPTIFATCIAKYFDNSIREDGLVSLARRGIVFAPGGAGTVQELFQDAAQNSYFALGEASPMVLLGTEFWTDTVPALGVLRSINPTSPWQDIVSVVDTAADAVAALQRSSPIERPHAPWSFCAAHCSDASVRPGQRGREASEPDRV